MTQPLTRTEITDLVHQLTDLLALIKTGEMTASTATARRVEGAIVGLEAALGQTDLTDRLLSDLLTTTL